MSQKFLQFIFLLFFAHSTYAVDFYISGTVSAPTSGCELTNSEQVTIIIGNAGAMTVANHTFDVSYTVNGNTVTETYTVNAGWGSSATFTYTFSTNADLSACQEHVFDFELSLTGDTNPANNTVNYSVFSDCAPTVGAISGISPVCEGNNSGTLTISGYNGSVNDWISSTDAGASWSSLANSSDDQTHTNVTTETWYKTIINSPYGYCPVDTCAPFMLEIDVPTVAGTLFEDGDICDNGNYGFINVTGSTGEVTDWQYSIDGGTTWNSYAPGNGTDTLWYTNIPVTTQFHGIVTNGSCSSETTNSITLSLIPGSNAGSIIGEDTVCNALADSLLTVSGYTGNIQSWIYSLDSGATWINTGQSSSSYSYASLFGYTQFGIIVQKYSCPNDTAFHDMVVLPISVSAGLDTTITEGDTIQLSGSGGVSYHWYPDYAISDSESQSPFVWPTYDYVYSVQVTDDYNCQDTASVNIRVLPDPYAIEIPNLVTPNGDGYNDHWVIKNILSYPEAEVYIFDAYGQLLFEQKNGYSNDWDITFNGDYLPDGTYFYIVKLNEDTDPKKGTLTVISKK